MFQAHIKEKQKEMIASKPRVGSTRGELALIPKKSGNAILEAASREKVDAKKT